MSSNRRDGTTERFPSPPVSISVLYRKLSEDHQCTESGSQATNSEDELDQAEEVRNSRPRTTRHFPSGCLLFLLSVLDTGFLTTVPIPRLYILKEQPIFTGWGILVPHETTAGPCPYSMNSGVIILVGSISYN